MMTELAELHAASLPPERFTRLLLAYLEAMTRRIALIALHEWNALQIPDETLFDVLRYLTRPAWGTWCRLVDAILKTAQNARTAGTPDQRQRVTDSQLLAEIDALWKTSLPPATKDLLKAFAPYTSDKGYNKVTLSAVIQRFLEVRNRISHDSVTREDYWTGLADASRPLLEQIRLLETPPWIASPPEPCEPWIYRKGEHYYEFNGLNDKLVASHIAADASRETSSERGAAVLSAIESLLGRSTDRTRDLRKLLSDLAPDDDRGVLLGDFLLQKIAGTGGFSIVYAGRQFSTGLRVAIKVLRDGFDDDVVDRFRREARYLARVAHPNIVRVIFSGRDPWSMTPELRPAGDWFEAEFKSSSKWKTYIAMEWIEGQTLEEIFRTQRPLPTKDVAAWFEQSTAALSVLHAQGIIHRDIKPANLMLATDETIKLMDLGVARTLRDGATRLTSIGTAIGTPAYMSPEQVRALDAEAEVGPQSDIYSLCATFYELFTGHRIFDHDVAPEFTVTTLKRAGQRPVAPRTHIRSLARELNSILQGGLEPEVTDRYRTAETLLTDIRHFLRDEPLEHEPPSLVRRLQLAYRRNRLVTNLVVTFIGIAVIGSGLYVDQILQERDRTRERYADLLFEQGRSAYDKGNPLEASVYLVEALKLGRDTTPLRMLLAAVMPSVDAYVRTLSRKDDPLGRPVLSPDGRMLAATATGDKVTLWNTEDGSLIRVLAQVQPCGRAPTFSPSGEWLVVCEGPTLRLMQPDGANQHCSLSGHTLEVIDVAFDDEERFLATASVDDTAILWSLPDCRLVTTLRGHNATINSVSLHSATATVLTAGNDGTARLWKLPSGTPLRTFRCPSGRPLDFARLSPDGDTVVATGKEVCLWDTKTGELRTVIDTAAIPSAAGYLGGPVVAPDLQTVLVQGETTSDWVLRNLRSGAEIFTLHGTEVVTATFNWTGTQLAVGGWDQRVQLFDTRDGSATLTLYGFGGAFPIGSIAFDRRDTLLAASNGDGDMRLWRLDRRHTPASIPHDLNGAILIARPPGTPETWIVYDDGRVIKHLPRLSDPRPAITRSRIAAAAIDVKSEHLALLEVDGAVSVWRIVDTNLIWRTTVEGPGELHFSPSGRTLSFVGRDRSISRFRTTDGAIQVHLQPPPPDFHSDAIHCGDEIGHCVAIGSNASDRLSAPLTVSPALYDYSARQVVRKVAASHRPPIMSAAFSPDGALVATAGIDHAVHLSVVKTGELYTSLVGLNNPVFSVGISPDNSMVLTATMGGTIQIWDAASGGLLRTFSGDNKANRTQFDQTGEMILQVTEGANRGIRPIFTPRETRGTRELGKRIRHAVPWKLDRGRLIKSVPESY